MAFILHLQHLPNTVDEFVLRTHFSRLAIREGGIHIIGGPNGDCFIEFDIETHVLKALSYDNQPIQGAAVKFYLAKPEDRDYIIAEAERNSWYHGTPFPSQTPEAPVPWRRRQQRTGLSDPIVEHRRTAALRSLQQQSGPKLDDSTTNALLMLKNVFDMVQSKKSSDLPNPQGVSTRPLSPQGYPSQPPHTPSKHQSYGSDAMSPPLPAPHSLGYRENSPPPPPPKMTTLKQVPPPAEVPQPVPPPAKVPQPVPPITKDPQPVLTKIAVKVSKNSQKSVRIGATSTVPTGGLVADYSDNDEPPPSTHPPLPHPVSPPPPPPPPPPLLQPKAKLSRSSKSPPPPLTQPEKDHSQGAKDFLTVSQQKNIGVGSIGSLTTTTTNAEPPRSTSSTTAPSGSTAGVPQQEALEMARNLLLKYKDKLPSNFLAPFAGLQQGSSTPANVLTTDDIRKALNHVHQIQGQGIPGAFNQPTPLPMPRYPIGSTQSHVSMENTPIPNIEVGNIPCQTQAPNSSLLHASSSYQEAAAPKIIVPQPYQVSVLRMDSSSDSDSDSVNAQIKKKASKAAQKRKTHTSSSSPSYSSSDNEKYSTRDTVFRKRRKINIGARKFGLARQSPSRSKSRSPDWSKGRPKSSSSRKRSRSRSGERKWASRSRKRSRSRDRSRKSSRSRERSRKKSRSRDRSRRRSRSRDKDSSQRSKSREEERAKAIEERLDNEAARFLNDPNSIVIEGIARRVTMQVLREFFYGSPVVEDGIALLPTKDAMSLRIGYIKFVHHQDVANSMHFNNYLLYGRKITIRPCVEPTPKGENSVSTGGGKKKSNSSDQWVSKHINDERAVYKKPLPPKTGLMGVNPFKVQNPIGPEFMLTEEVGENEKNLCFLQHKSLEPGQTACEVWSWYRDRYPTLGCILSSSSDGKPCSAYVAFVGQEHRNTAHRLVRWTKCGKLPWNACMRRISNLTKEGNRFSLSTFSGIDRDIAEEEKCYADSVRDATSNAWNAYYPNLTGGELDGKSSAGPMTQYDKEYQASIAKAAEDDVGDRLYYIRMRKIPEKVEANRVWKWFGCAAGNSKSVVIVKNEFNISMSAYIGFATEAHMKEAMMKQSFCKPCEYHTRNIFLTSLKPGWCVCEPSTTPGQDRLWDNIDFDILKYKMRQYTLCGKEDHIKRMQLEREESCKEAVAPYQQNPSSFIQMQSQSQFQLPKLPILQQAAGYVAYPTVLQNPWIENKTPIPSPNVAISNQAQKQPMLPPPLPSNAPPATPKPPMPVESPPSEVLIQQSPRFIVHQKKDDPAKPPLPKSSPCIKKISENSTKAIGKDPMMVLMEMYNKQQEKDDVYKDVRIVFDKSGESDQAMFQENKFKAQLIECAGRDEIAEVEMEDVSASVTKGIAQNILEKKELSLMELYNQQQEQEDPYRDIRSAKCNDAHTPTETTSCRRSAKEIVEAINKKRQEEVKEHQVVSRRQRLQTNLLSISARIEAIAEKDNVKIQVETEKLEKANEKLAQEVEKKEIEKKKRLGEFWDSTAEIEAMQSRQHDKQTGEDHELQQDLQTSTVDSKDGHISNKSAGSNQAWLKSIGSGYAKNITEALAQRVTPVQTVILPQFSPTQPGSLGVEPTEAETGGPLNFRTTRQESKQETPSTISVKDTLITSPETGKEKPVCNSQPVGPSASSSSGQSVPAHIVPSGPPAVDVIPKGTRIMPPYVLSAEDVMKCMTKSQRKGVPKREKEASVKLPQEKALEDELRAIRNMIIERARKAQNTVISEALKCSQKPAVHGTSSTTQNTESVAQSEGTPSVQKTRHSKASAVACTELRRPTIQTAEVGAESTKSTVEQGTTEESTEPTTQITEPTSQITEPTSQIIEPTMKGMEPTGEGSLPEVESTLPKAPDTGEFNAQAKAQGEVQGDRKLPQDTSEVQQTKREKSLTLSPINAGDKEIIEAIFTSDEPGPEETSGMAISRFIGPLLPGKNQRKKIRKKVAHALGILVSDTYNMTFSEMFDVLEKYEERARKGQNTVISEALKMDEDKVQEKGVKSQLPDLECTPQKPPVHGTSLTTQSTKSVAQSGGTPSIQKTGHGKASAVACTELRRPTIQTAEVGAKSTNSTVEQGATEESTEPTTQITEPTSQITEPTLQIIEPTMKGMEPTGEGSPPEVESTQPKAPDTGEFNAQAKAQGEVQEDRKLPQDTSEVQQTKREKSPTLSPINAGDKKVIEAIFTSDEPGPKETSVMAISGFIGPLLPGKNQRKKIRKKVAHALGILMSDTNIMTFSEMFDVLEKYEELEKQRAAKHSVSAPPKKTVTTKNTDALKKTAAPKKPNKPSMRARRRKRQSMLAEQMKQEMEDKGVFPLMDGFRRIEDWPHPKQDTIPPLMENSSQASAPAFYSGINHSQNHRVQTWKEWKMERKILMKKYKVGPSVGLDQPTPKTPKLVSGINKPMPPGVEDKATFPGWEPPPPGFERPILKGSTDPGIPGFGATVIPGIMEQEPCTIALVQDSPTSDGENLYCQPVVAAQMKINKASVMEVDDHSGLTPPITTPIRKAQMTLSFKAPALTINPSTSLSNFPQVSPGTSTLKRKELSESEKQDQLQRLLEYGNTVYFRLSNLRKKITAGEVWSWFRGRRGPTVGATLVRDCDGVALTAFVGFQLGHEEYLDNVQKETYTLVSPAERNIELASLSESNQVIQSTTSGDQIVEGEVLQLFKNKILSDDRSSD